MASGIELIDQRQQRLLATKSIHMSFSQAQRLYIKRAKIGVNIILKESDESAKYELFQRLNTGGSPLSPQEVRNCILVMLNRDRYLWLRQLSQNTDFRECVALTDRAIEEQYDMDLVLRFLLFRRMLEERIKSVGDLNEFLTDRMMESVRSENYDTVAEERAFNQTFDILNRDMGADAFRRYDPDKDRFMGGFLISAFEVVAIGIGYHQDDSYAQFAQMNLRDKIKNLWANTQFRQAAISSEVRASSCIPKTIPLGRRQFTP